MKRLIIVFSLMAFTFTGMAYARTYKIGVLPWVGFSPNNVADAKGFWKAQGLDVQVVNFSNCQDMQNGLMYKRIDIAHQMIGSWIGLHMEDVPITILAELDWSHGGDKIIVKKTGISGT